MLATAGIPATAGMSIGAVMPAKKKCNSKNAFYSKKSRDACKRRKASNSMQVGYCKDTSNSSLMILGT
jgi:hypothetical protein